MSEPGRLALFRCDAGIGIGNGHVVRCLALAAELRHRGFDVVFAGNEAAAELVSVLSDGEFRFIPVAAGDASAALKAAEPNGCTVAVVDHYGLDHRYEGDLRGWATKIAVIDDLANRRHDCDLLIDQTMERDTGDYRSLLPPGCRQLVGPQYALLRPEFSHLRPMALRRDPERPVRRLLVAMGGVDGKGMTPRVLEAAAELGLEVDVVLGGLANTLQEVKRYPAKLHVDTTEMAELTAAADLAVGAGGMSAYERCCLALPSIVIQVAQNQAAQTRALARAGAIVDVGPSDAVTVGGLAEVVRDLVCDTLRRAAMARAAARICDGQGAGRVAAAMAPSPSSP